ncbi:unnamed protein product [Paramecium primaurelia]|uniref:Transmembrane protein n=1 Tax=Paramecium primaurelia TaxID=5886 RepID=A0A8S1PNZ5_PARPR|nr:unnamed protein product [Paramecium primaurelia]
MSISEIIPIVDSQYFFGLYKSELKLFQVQPPKYYHSFNTSQRIIFLIFQRWTYLTKFILMQSNIEILNESVPRIIIDKKDMIIESHNNDEICILQSKITQSLPINLQTIQDNDRYYQINNILNIETHNLYFGEYSKVLNFWKFNDQTNVILVLIQSKDLIILIFCKQNKILKKQNIKIKQNYIDIGVLQNSNILVFYEDQIQHYKIVDSQQIQKTQFVQDQKIIKLNKLYNQIVISYDNCKKSVVKSIDNNFIFMQQPQNYPFDCTQMQQISITNLYIFQTYIVYNLNHFKQYIQVGKIIDILIDVDQRLYVLILDEEDEIVLKLFRFLRTPDFIFIYKIPTYNFKFQLSVNQKIENSYLMITAKYQNKTYLLVYNLRNQAINSLIYITEIDQSNQFYSYYDFTSNSIVFIKDGKFYFHKLNQICFKYTFFEENFMIQKKQLKLNFNSFINNFNFTTKLLVSKLNSDYTLSLLKQGQKRNIYYQGNLDLNQIRGNIIKFEIQPTQDFIIKLPINITQEYFICSYYQSSICLKNRTSIIIQSLNISVQLPFELDDNSIKGIVYNQESLTYSIFFVDPNRILLQLMLQLGNNESKQFTILTQDILYNVLKQEEIELINKVKIIKEITIFFNQRLFGLIFYNNYCQIIDISEINSTQYFLIDGAYLSNNTYVFLYRNYSIIQMKIIAFNNIQLISEFQCKGDIIQEHQFNLIEIFERVYTQTYDDVLSQLEIIHLEMKGDQFIMKFVMIYMIYFNIIFEISFNNIKYDNFHLLSYKFLRYEQNTHFLDLLYADNNFVMITLSSDSNSFINVYDIKGEMKYKDYLDSIQRIESFQYKKIEKYNASHYVINNHQNNRVTFVTINQLQIECQGQCNEPSNLILSNDVSSISLEIQLNNKSYLNVIITINSRIIMTNLIFILIYIKFGKRAKRNYTKQFYGNS